MKAKLNDEEVDLRAEASEAGCAEIVDSYTGNLVAEAGCYEKPAQVMLDDNRVICVFSDYWKDVFPTGTLLEVKGASES